MNAEDVQIKEVIALLERVVDGSLEAREALNRWPHFERLHIEKKKRKLLDRAWVQLQDYMEDQDIRDREPEYGKQQRRYLLKKIHGLKILLYA